jgi:type IV pilus assembly protein PilA
MKFTLNSAEVRRRKGGFTLIEIMVVVVIIGLLVALSVPIWARARRNSQENAFVNDLRIGIQALQRCMFEQGAWPAEVAAGTAPPATAGYLNDLYWTKLTPLGGNWDWEYNNSSVVAGIAIVPSLADADMMTEIDQKIDDGNLSTGNFRSASGKYIYILEP